MLFYTFEKINELYKKINQYLYNFNIAENFKKFKNNLKSVSFFCIIKCRFYF